MDVGSFEIEFLKLIINKPISISQFSFINHHITYQNEHNYQSK